MPLIKDPERFSYIAGGAQSIVIGLAVVIGGVWTAYTFVSLQSVAKAKAELAAATFRRPIVEVQLSTSILGTIPGSFVQPLGMRNMHLVEVTAQLTNRGNLYEHIDLSKETLRVAKIAIARDGNIDAIPGFGLRALGMDGSLDGVLLRASGSQQLHYVMGVDDGLYLLEFKVPAAPSSAADAYLDAPGLKPNLWWGAQAFLFVPTDDQSSKPQAEPSSATFRKIQ